MVEWVLLVGGEEEREGGEVLWRQPTREIRSDQEERDVCRWVVKEGDV